MIAICRRRARAGRGGRGLRPSLLLAAVAVLSGCGGGVDDVDESLSAGEIRGMIEVLHATHAFDGYFGDTNPWQCPDGGSVSQLLSLAYADSTLLLAGTLTYEGCTGVSTRGDRFSLSGDLSVSWTYDMDSFGRVVGGDGSDAGDVSWKVGGRSGSCSLDLASAMVADSIHVTGAACGEAVDQTMH